MNNKCHKKTKSADAGCFEVFENDKKFLTCKEKAVSGSK